MPFLQKALLGLETLSRKWRRKIRGQKAAKPSFSSHLFCSIITRERVGETRDSERDTHADTHTHTHTQSFYKESQRERRCVIVRFVRVTREREIDAFFFRGVTDELIQTRERR